VIIRPGASIHHAIPAADAGSKYIKEFIMQTSDLEKYCANALQCGATHAKIIHPSTVVTGAWVRFKCLYGCPYKDRYSCPPHTPTPEETQNVLNSYSRAILFHAEAPSTKERNEKMTAYLDYLVKMEGELFKDGYYKAFVMLAGACTLCKQCGKVEGIPCRLPAKTRPSMESCGIDVFQTARNHGFSVTPLKEKTETRNIYCLMLVD
jgi:predicted metal-binding protein